MQTLSKSWLVLILMSLSACAAFTPAESFDQQLAYAYGVHTAVLQTAANSVDYGSLSVDDAKQILQLADQSRALLDAARIASGAGDVKTAEGQLALATNILVQLQTYVRSRSK